MTKKKIADENQPWTANYPPLDAWLKEHGHSCMWQARTNGNNPESSIVEAWLTKPPSLGIVIIVVHAGRRGWDMYTAPNTNRITETLADAERRLANLLEPTLRDAFVGGVQTVEPHTSTELESLFETWLASTRQSQ